MTENYLSIELTNNSDFPYYIRLKSTLVEHLKCCYRQQKYYESGGILFGKVRRDNIIEIESIKIIKSKRTFRYAYVRNNKKARQSIYNTWNESNGFINYIGEWHTHPRISPPPSQTDLVTILELTKEKNSGFFPYTFLIIVGKNEEITLTICSERGVVECIHIQ